MTVLPMLASPTSSAGNRRPIVLSELMSSGDWIADTKLDGVRALIHWDGSAFTITNRNGVNTTHKYPELRDPLHEALAGEKALILDGEIISRDGSFESTLLRDQQESASRIKALSQSRPCMFIAFDLPEFRTPWRERRDKLERFAETITLTTYSPDADFLEKTRELGMEGVVAKHVNGRYEFGKRSKMWLKFRNRYRITCLVAGYAPGQGSRSEFGAMVLALIDPASGGVLEVGRVGTGFKEAEIPALKEHLDAGRLLVVEIETTNQTSGGQLRFPVYRGIRADVLPQDCTVEQLQFLPTM